MTVFLPDHFLTRGNQAAPIYFSNASLKILQKSKKEIR